MTIQPPQTVNVRIINGKYRPCDTCRWFSICVVPRGRSLSTYWRQPIREYYQCEDYINNRMPTDESSKLNN
jgi:hypothetical protein